MPSSQKRTGGKDQKELLDLEGVFFLNGEEREADVDVEVVEAGIELGKVEGGRSLLIAGPGEVVGINGFGAAEGLFIIKGRVASVDAHVDGVGFTVVGVAGVGGTWVAGVGGKFVLNEEVSIGAGNGVGAEGLGGRPVLGRRKYGLREVRRRKDHVRFIAVAIR